jgi:HAD superfamily hydrolase (TIGR01458 family)
MDAASSRTVCAVLLDIQGTLLLGDGSSVLHAAEAVGRLKADGFAVRYVTNIDSVGASAIAARLQAAGIPATEEEIFSPVAAAKRFLDRHNRARCFLLVAPEVEPEFDAYRAANGRADYVIVGDCREGFTYERLNEAFRSLRSGAGLVALQKGAWFLSSAGPALDTGAFVTALEYASGQQAYVLGKPSTELLRLAMEDAGCDAYRTLMVGDDVVSDVAGAQALGARCVLVRTGKYSLALLERSERKPDLVIDSVADLPDALGELYP